MRTKKNRLSHFLDSIRETLTDTENLQLMKTDLDRNTFTTPLTSTLQNLKLNNISKLLDICQSTKLNAKLSNEDIVKKPKRNTNCFMKIS